MVYPPSSFGVCLHFNHSELIYIKGFSFNYKEKVPSHLAKQNKTNRKRAFAGLLKKTERMEEIRRRKQEIGKMGIDASDAQESSDALGEPVQANNNPGIFLDIGASSPSPSRRLWSESYPGYRPSSAQFCSAFMKYISGRSALDRPAWTCRDQPQESRPGS